MTILAGLRSSELQMQVEELASELNCIIQQGINTPGMMYVEEDPPRIEGPIIGTFTRCDLVATLAENIEICYVTLLHELGHVAHGHTQGRPPHTLKTHYFDNGVLNSEAEAWDWALDHILYKTLRPATIHCIRDLFLGSYHRQAQKVGLFTPGQRLGNGNRHYVAFSYGDDTRLRSTRRRMTSLVL